MEQIPSLIYVIGSVTAAFISVRWWHRETADEVRVVDLVILAVFMLLTALLSWVFVLFMLLNKYGDRVVFKKKKSMSNGKE